MTFYEFAERNPGLVFFLVALLAYFIITMTRIITRSPEDSEPMITISFNSEEEKEDDDDD